MSGEIKLLISNPDPDGMDCIIKPTSGEFDNLGPKGAVTDVDVQGNVGFYLSPRLEGPNVSVDISGEFDIEGKYAIEINGGLLTTIFNAEDLPKHFVKGNPTGLVIVAVADQPLIPVSPDGGVS